MPWEQRHPLSADARRRLIEQQQERWAERLRAACREDGEEEAPVAPPLQPGVAAQSQPPPAVTVEVPNWLREAAGRAAEDEEARQDEPESREDFPLETAGFEPCEFQLANGNNVKVVFAKFWERIRYQDWREGARPAQYYAIKVYSTEDILPRRMAIHCEFRHGNDFPLTAIPKIWDWIEWLMEPRRLAEFDSLAEFIDALAEEMNRLSDEGEDAVEHIDHLPQLADPKAFDHEDDSIYNDQNEPELPKENRD